MAITLDVTLLSGRSVALQLPPESAALGLASDIFLLVTREEGTEKDTKLPFFGIIYGLRLGIH